MSRLQKVYCRHPELVSGSKVLKYRFRAKGIPMGKQVRNDDLLPNFKFTFQKLCLAMG